MFYPFFTTTLHHNMVTIFAYTLKHFYHRPLVNDSMGRRRSLAVINNSFPDNFTVQ